MEVLEDWRLLTVATATGWYTVAILDDGVELIESVDLEVVTTPRG